MIFSKTPTLEQAIFIALLEKAYSYYTLFFHTYLLGLPYKHLCEVKSMFKHDMESHTLVDDTGIHEDTKVKKITFFVGLCRLVTVILIVLGVLNLIYGNI